MTIEKTTDDKKCLQLIGSFCYFASSSVLFSENVEEPYRYGPTVIKFKRFLKSFYHESKFAMPIYRKSVRFCNNSVIRSS